MKAALEHLHRSEMPGAYAEVRDGGQMRQRVGSITRSFTAAAIVQQVAAGRIRLDAPIGAYLPKLVPGARDRRTMVRMLLNHTSGMAEYLPSLQGFSSDPDVTSLDDNRFRQFSPEELIEMGLGAPAGGQPGGPTGVYSNTDYVLLGRLLKKVTGTTAEKYITQNVTRRAGLRHTGFPGRTASERASTARCSRARWSTGPT